MFLAELREFGACILIALAGIAIFAGVAGGLCAALYLLLQWAS